MLTRKRLRELLIYNPCTGVFTWISGARTGKSAGYVNKSLGYILIGIDGKSYYAHRLACLYVTGKFPDDETEHDDRNRANNCWWNKATSLQNKANVPLLATNTSGVRGVSFARNLNKWHAYIGHPRVNLGWFSGFDEAVIARRRAELERYGEFAK